MKYAKVKNIMVTSSEIIKSLELFPLSLGSFITKEDHYYCSKSGHIYRRDGVDFFVKLNPTPDENGYLKIKLYMWVDEETKIPFSFRVHRIILESWVRYNMPNEFQYMDFSGIQVDHIDGDTSNNSIGNIRWITNYRNAARKKANRHNWPQEEKDIAFKEYFLNKKNLKAISKIIHRGVDGIGALLKSQEAFDWCKKNNVQYNYRKAIGGVLRTRKRDLDVIQIPDKVLDRICTLYFKKKYTMTKISKKLHTSQEIISNVLNSVRAIKWCSYNDIEHRLR